MSDHLFIPDCQVKAGVPLDHIEAAGKLIVKRRPDVIIVIGDFFDMESLGTHSDRGNVHYHNKSYAQDLESGIEAMELLLRPLTKLQKKQRNNKKKVYQPRLVFTMGNHEARLDKLEADNPKLIGALYRPDDYLSDRGFEVYPFKEPVEIDGVTYCHLCPQTKSAGAVERPHLILNKRHSSWSVGHSQGFEYFISAHEPVTSPCNRGSWAEIKYSKP